MPIILY